MTLSSESIAKLLTCKDYRSFMLTYKQERSHLANFSYSLVAQRAGFSSRSFPRDVANGLKNISLNSLYPMLKGLGLKGDLAEYFKTLVFLEHPEICHPPKSSFELQKKLRNIQERLINKNKAIVDDPFLINLFPIVYSACGGPETGATLEEIRKKTNLPKSEIESVLNKLSSLGTIRKKNRKFFVSSNHFYNETISKSQGLKRYFQYLLGQASEKAQKNFSSKENLFFVSTLSVKSTNLKNLKNDLRQTLLRYVDEAEDADGDKVVSIVCSLI